MLAKRAVKEEAKAAVAVPPVASERPGAPGAPAQAAPSEHVGLIKGRPWGALALQLLVAAMLSSGRASLLPLLVAFGLCYLSLRDYNANWIRFFSVMCVVSLVLRLL